MAEIALSVPTNVASTDDVPDGLAVAALANETEGARPNPLLALLQQSNFPSLEQQKSPSLTAAP